MMACWPPAGIVAVEFDPAHLDSLGFDPEELLEFFAQRDFCPYSIERKSGISKVEVHTLLEPKSGPPRYMDLLYLRDPSRLTQGI